MAEIDDGLGVAAGANAAGRRLGDVWQKGYHDLVVRDEAELERIRAYIEANPTTWDEDRENPVVAGRGGRELWEE